MTEEIIKIGIDRIVEIGEFNIVDKVEVDQGMNKIIGEKILVLCMVDGGILCISYVYLFYVFFIYCVTYLFFV